jgi:hypothetical protein
MAEVIEALLREVRSLRKLVEERGTERLTVNFKEAGEMLGRSAKTIARMEKRGQLQSVLIGGDKMIPVLELRRVATPAAEQKRSGGRKTIEPLPSAKSEAERAREMLKRR